MPTSFREILLLFKSRTLGGELARGSAGVFTIKIIDLVLRFALGVILARVLGAEGFGMYNYALSVVLILSIPTQLGLPNLLIRFIPNYESREEWAKIKGLLSFTNTAVLVLSLIIITAAFIYVWLRMSFQNEITQTFAWALGLLPLLALGALRASALRGLRHIVLGLAPDMIVRTVSFLILLILTYYIIGAEYFSASNAMVMHVISAGIAFIIGSYWLYMRMPQLVKKIKSKFETRIWLTVSFPFMLTGSMHIINGRIDIVLLGWFRTVSEVGYYEVAVRGAAFILLGLTITNQIIGPYISKFFAEKDSDRLKKIIITAMRLNIIVSVPIAIALILFGDVIIGFIFGVEFAISYKALVILSFSQLINVFSGAVALLLNMTGYERQVLYAVASSAILNFLLNIILIPIYGIVGAAVATLITTALWNISLVLYSFKELGIDPSIFNQFFR